MKRCAGRYAAVAGNGGVSGLEAWLELRRTRVRRAAGTISAGGGKTGAAAEVVEWMLPRASSSLSRADAMRRLPEYSARLIGG